MATIGERLRAAIEKQWGGSIRSFQKQMDARLRTRGGKGITYPTINSYLKDESSPPVEFLREAAELTGVRPAWLVLEEGGPTQPDRELNFVRDMTEEARNLEERDWRALAHIMTPLWQEYGIPPQGSSQYFAALRRFARKLREAEVPDSPWMGNDAREQLLRAAAVFLLGVDATFERAGLQQADGSPELPAEGKRPFGEDLLLRSSSSIGWNVAWHDAVLDLFARRVKGLGERSGHWLDAHAPTFADRVKDYREFL